SLISKDLLPGSYIRVKQHILQSADSKYPSFEGRIYDSYKIEDSALKLGREIAGYTIQPVTFGDKQYDLLKQKFENNEEQISLISKDLLPGSYIRVKQHILQSADSKYPSFEGRIYDSYKIEDSALKLGNVIAGYTIQPVAFGDKQYDLLKQKFENNEEQISLISKDLLPGSYIRVKQHILQSADSKYPSFEGRIYDSYKIEDSALKLGREIAGYTIQPVAFGDKQYDLLKQKFENNEEQISLISKDLLPGSYIRVKQHILQSADSKYPSFEGRIYQDYNITKGNLFFGKQIGTYTLKPVNVAGKQADLLELSIKDKKQFSLVYKELLKNKYITVRQDRLYPKEGKGFPGRIVLEDLQKIDFEGIEAKEAKPIFYFRYDNKTKTISTFGRDSRPADTKTYSNVLGWSVELGEKTLVIDNQKIEFELFQQINWQGKLVKEFGMVEGEELIRVRYERGLFQVKEVEGIFKQDEGATYIVGAEENGKFITQQKLFTSKEIKFNSLPADWQAKINLYFSNLEKTGKFSFPMFKKFTSELGWEKIKGIKEGIEGFTLVKIDLVSPLGKSLVSSYQAFKDSDYPEVIVFDTGLVDIPVNYKGRRVSLRFDLDKKLNGGKIEPVAISSYLYFPGRELIIDLYKNLLFIEDYQLSLPLDSPFLDECDRFRKAREHLRKNNLFAKNWQQILDELDSISQYRVDDIEEFSYENSPYPAAMLKALEIPASTVTRYFITINGKDRKVEISQGKLEKEGIDWENGLIISSHQAILFDENNKEIGRVYTRDWRDFRGNLRMKFFYRDAVYTNPVLGTYIYDLDKHGIGKNSVKVVKYNDEWVPFEIGKFDNSGVLNFKDLNGEDYREKAFFFKVARLRPLKIDFNKDNLAANYFSLKGKYSELATPQQIRKEYTMGRSGEGKLVLRLDKDKLINKGKVIKEIPLITFILYDPEALSMMEASCLHLDYNKESYTYRYNPKKGFNSSNYAQASWWARDIAKLWHKIDYWKDSKYIASLYNRRFKADKLVYDGFDKRESSLRERYFRVDGRDYAEYYEGIGIDNPKQKMVYLDEVCLPSYSTQGIKPGWPARLYSRIFKNENKEELYSKFQIYFQYDGAILWQLNEERVVSANILQQGTSRMYEIAGENPNRQELSAGGTTNFIKSIWYERKIVPYATMLSLGEKELNSLFGKLIDMWKKDVPEKKIDKAISESEEYKKIEYLGQGICVGAFAIWLAKAAGIFLGIIIFFGLLNKLWKAKFRRKLDKKNFNEASLEDLLDWGFLKMEAVEILRIRRH
ncbi:MAG: hypothetical protein ABIK26_06540, partial [Candidatus Omnitrophota bacterium]